MDTTTIRIPAREVRSGDQIEDRTVVYNTHSAGARSHRILKLDQGVIIAHHAEKFTVVRQEA